MNAESGGRDRSRSAPLPEATESWGQNLAPTVSPSKRSAVEFTRIDQIQPRPTAWLIDEYLVRNTVAGLIAPPSSGKSFLAVDWACRIATGLPWAGRQVHRGPVFYLAGEGVQGLRKRTRGWEISHGVSLAGAPLFVSAGIPALCDPSNTAAVVTAIAQNLYAVGNEAPVLIVVDTVARAMAGFNENSNDDMGRLIGACDELRERWGSTVLTVHHPGHDGERARGASSYMAALDSDFYLKASKEGIELRSGTKAKDWPAPPAIRLHRTIVNLGGDGNGSPPETTLALHPEPAAPQDDRRDTVAAMLEEGRSYREIEIATGVSKSTVCRWKSEDVSRPARGKPPGAAGQEGVPRDKSRWDTLGHRDNSDKGRPPST